MMSAKLQTGPLLLWLQGPRLGPVVRLVNLLLVIWLAYLLADLTWQLVPTVPEDDAALAAPVARTDASPSPAEDKGAKEVAMLHLFGEASAKPIAPKVVAPREAPDTRLKLTLKGLFASDEAAEAMAIVADAKGDEKPYRIGDPLPGGAELKEIYTDRIILMRSGRFETLRLPRDQEAGAAGRRAARSAQPASVAPRSAQNLKQYRESLRNNPQSLLKLVRPQPVRENGKFVGYRLLPGREGGLLKDLGLLPGDVVTGINGVALNSPTQGMKALQALQKHSNVNLDVRRGGQTIALNLDIPR